MYKIAICHPRTWCYTIRGTLFPISAFAGRHLCPLTCGLPCGVGTTLRTTIYFHLQHAHALIRMYYLALRSTFIPHVFNCSSTRPYTYRVYPTLMAIPTICWCQISISNNNCWAKVSTNTQTNTYTYTNTCTHTYKRRYDSKKRETYKQIQIKTNKQKWSL
jgi:hypothetical protein